MSRYIMSIALLGAFLVAAPAMADFELFKTWRESKGSVYEEDATVVTLITLKKDGPLSTNTANPNILQPNPSGQQVGGTVSATSYSAAWTATKTAGGATGQQDWWINFNSNDDPTTYADLAIALIGPMGSNGLAGVGATGLQGQVSINVTEAGIGFDWVTLGMALGSLASSNGVVIERQSYLNGVPSSSTDIKPAQDTGMETFLYSDMITGMLGGSGQVGGVEIRFGSTFRNQNSLSLIAITQTQAVGPGTAVPEPATLALMGLGLAGLGIARRRMRK